MKFLTSVAFIITVFASSNGFAHTSLKESLPKNNAMLMSSPPQLSVTFAEPVRLAKLSLHTKNGEAVSFGFAPTTNANSTFSFELPLLSPDTYVAEWMLLGEDGHKMDGKFTFMVHANNTMKHDKHTESEHKNH